MDGAGTHNVPERVLRLVSARCRELADQLILEETDSPRDNFEIGDGLRGHRQSETTLSRLKKLKQGGRSAFGELWDEESQHFTTDVDRMASIIKDSARKRQGEVQASPFAYRQFLYRTRSYNKWLFH